MKGQFLRSSFINQKKLHERYSLFYSHFFPVRKTLESEQANVRVIIASFLRKEPKNKVSILNSKFQFFEYSG